MGLGGGGGTEAFPDLGRHCQNSDCNQLDFLPFKCDGCNKVFCLEHRSYKSHDCPKSDHNSRKVLVCETCSAAIETITGLDDKLLLERHLRSGSCDPKNKRKPTCPVRRCKEVLTFSNTSTCKTCHLNVCLKHRFPADHACSKQPPSSAVAAGGNGGRRWNDKFLASWASRNGKDCAKSGTSGSVSPPNTPSVKAC
ncbi:Zinc finger transcription factor [Parasponia andersonii]|uniref:Zinc finger transcription factor n=1 Tax=Parasponia andersonii TaxID=3476 RepID=A0A2P5BFD8_PARAD|nr:Zinc finger transcription factor [Parasponia andersonii]